MFRVRLADNANNTLAGDDLAMLAALPDRCLDFHCSLSLVKNYLYL
jgi:hypothetical protein